MNWKLGNAIFFVKRFGHPKRVHRGFLILFFSGPKLKGIKYVPIPLKTFYKWCTIIYDLRHSIEITLKNNKLFTFRVTRTLFAFSEMTNMDPNYTGPEFDFDKIIKELMNKVRLFYFTIIIHNQIIQIIFDI